MQNSMQTSFHQAFFSSHFNKVKMVQLYSCTDMAHFSWMLHTSDLVSNLAKQVTAEANIIQCLLNVGHPHIFA